MEGVDPEPPIDVKILANHQFGVGGFDMESPEFTHYFFWEAGFAAFVGGFGISSHTDIPSHQHLVCIEFYLHSSIDRACGSAFKKKERGIAPPPQLLKEPQDF
jgi:hypothetical protein